MEYVAAAARNVFERKDLITRGVSISWEAPIMRHFTIKLDKL
jgi:tryptophanase